MMISLPNYVKICLNTLETNGFEAWCVGGAVRDLIMGQAPFDFDITTNAEPNDVIRIFEKTVPTGIKHGTVTVVTKNGNVEVTTYRSESDYLNNRSPKSVSFEKDIKKDLLRRDFTVNAICYNEQHGFFDFVGGIDDINNKIIRAIGNPDERFSEDALRILRAFRFSAQLNFKIEDSTLKSALSHSKLLQNISAERIYSELYKIFLSKNIDNALPLLNSGALNFLGFNNSEIPQNFNMLVKAFPIRFAVFCSENNLDAFSILKMLRTDNDTIAKTKEHLSLLNITFPLTKPEIKRLLSNFSLDAIVNILKYLEICGLRVDSQLNIITDIINNNEPYSLNMLAINGDDLLRLGFSGKDIGDILERLLDIVIEHPRKNNKDTLIKLI